MASDDEEDSVVISIRKFAGQEIATLTLPKGSTVLQIKQVLAEKCGALPLRQRLLAECTVLPDEQIITKSCEFVLVLLQWKSDELDFATGDLVQLHYDGNVVYDSLQGTGQAWDDLMNEMLGRTFTVRGVPAEGFVALPSPDPSKAHEDVIFPKAVVRSGEELKEGDIVRMNSSEQSVRLSFTTSNYAWDDLMCGMLGKEFPIVEMTNSGLIGLPPPVGVGSWMFPVSAVTKSAAEHETIVRRAPATEQPPAATEG